MLPPGQQIVAFDRGDQCEPNNRIYSVSIGGVYACLALRAGVNTRDGLKGLHDVIRRRPRRQNAGRTMRRGSDLCRVEALGQSIFVMTVFLVESRALSPFTLVGEPEQKNPEPLIKARGFSF